MDVWELLSVRQSHNCPSGYLWYTCDFDGADYAGCCKVNACQQSSVGCPAEDSTAELSSTSSQTTTATETASTSTAIATATSASASPGAASSSSGTSALSTTLVTTTSADSSNSAISSSSAPLSAASSTSSATGTSSTSSSGPNLSAGAIAGIAIGGFLVVAFLAIWACMCLGRRQRKKDDERGTAALNQITGDAGPNVQATRGGDSTNKLPQDLDKNGGETPFEDVQEGSLSAHRRSTNNVQANSVCPPIGHYSNATPSPSEGTGGFQRDSRVTAHSSLVSPMSPNGVLRPELASTPVHELDSSPPPSQGPAELDPPASSATTWPAAGAVAGVAYSATPTTETVAHDRPRATLNSTRWERESNVHANSWSKYPGVQL